MEREAKSYEETRTKIEDYESHEDDEMTEVELDAMQLGSDFFSPDELAALCAFASKPVRSHHEADHAVVSTGAADEVGDATAAVPKTKKPKRWHLLKLQGWKSRRIRRMPGRGLGSRRNVA